MKASYYPYSRREEPVTCSMCGRTLGTTFHFTCHICGAAYCYIHMPDRCSHSRIRGPIILSVGNAVE